MVVLPLVLALLSAAPVAAKPIVRLSMSTWSQREAGVVLRASDRAFSFRATMLNIGSDSDDGGHGFNVFRFGLRTQAKTIRFVKSDLDGQETVVESRVRNLDAAGLCEFVGVLGTDDDEVTRAVGLIQPVVIRASSSKLPTCANGASSLCGFSALPVGIGLRRRAVLVPGCNSRPFIFTAKSSASGVRLTRQNTASFQRKEVSYGNVEIDVSTLVGNVLIVVPSNIFDASRRSDTRISIVA